MPKAASISLTPYRLFDRFFSGGNGPALSSRAGERSEGICGGKATGANQPVQPRSACWRNTSRLRESAGRDSKGPRKRATLCSPRQAVLGTETKREGYNGMSTLVIKKFPNNYNDPTQYPAQLLPSHGY